MGKHITWAHWNKNEPDFIFVCPTKNRPEIRAILLPLTTPIRHDSSSRRMFFVSGFVSAGTHPAHTQCDPRLRRRQPHPAGFHPAPLCESPQKMHSIFGGPIEGNLFARLPAHKKTPAEIRGFYTLSNH